MKYVRDCWYAAAWSEDIGRELFARTLLEEGVLFFRKEGGDVVAMRDRCPHRLVPLSMGRLVGDDVECIYHGLKFDCSGRCIANPNGNEAIPRAANVTAYIVAERFNIVWIWMGDPQRADPALIPQMPWLDDQVKYAEIHGTTMLPANYLLVVDNLMDLRHVAFLHQGLEPREHALIPVKDSEDTSSVWSKIFSPSSAPPPFFARKMHGPVDHWQEVVCYPPTSLVIFYGVTEVGAARSDGLETFNIQFVTPETSSTSHYLWASVRNFDLQDSNLTEGLREASSYAFANEDSPVLAAQQRAIGDRDLMECHPVLFSNDVAAVRVRRQIERLIQGEEARSGNQCKTMTLATA